MANSSTSSAVHASVRASVSRELCATPPDCSSFSTHSLFRLYLNVSTVDVKEKHQADSQKTRKTLKETFEAKRLLLLRKSASRKPVFAVDAVVCNHCLKLDRGLTSCLCLPPLWNNLPVLAISSKVSVFSTPDWSWTSPLHICPARCVFPLQQMTKERAPSELCSVIRCIRCE